MIRCLSLYQPWAALMFAVPQYRKQVETRHWSTTYRGLLVIHAAKRWSREQEEMSQSFVPGVATIVAQVVVPLHFGCYLGVVRLVGCKSTNHWQPDTDLERALGNYGPNRYAWLCEDARTFPEPIPGPGRRSFWTAPLEIESAVLSLTAGRANPSLIHQSGGT